MGKREERLRTLFNTLTDEEKRDHTRKIAEYRALGQAQRCPSCGRPTAGFIPDGMTMQQVGICTC
jgi:hypothetical protein